jgi:lipopolysaccharide biosynthesis glycosyltransferase
MEPLNVVIASDDNFAMPLTVSMSSIIETVTESVPLRFHVLDMGIKPANKTAILTAADRAGVSLHWVDSLADKVVDLPNTWPNITRAGYARLFIPEVLPDDVHRVLYVDCDVMARSSITDLMSVDMGGNAAMGVADTQSPFVSSPNAVPWWFRNGRRADEPNINSGVLLIDVDLWRTEKLGRQILEYLMDGRHEFGQDQEAINAVIGTRIGLLDPRWNQQSELFTRQYESELPYDTETLEVLRSDPWLIHFSNARKPWMYGCHHPFAHEWLAHLDRTPFSGTRPSFVKYVAKRGRRVPRWALSQLRPS